MRLLLHIVCLLLLVRGQSQTLTLKGYVLSEENQTPVAQVHIQLYNSTWFCVTNTTGYFECSVPLQPSYKLIFTRFGFTSQVKQFRLSDTGIIRITLKENPFLLQGVDVKARALPETLVGKPDYSILDFDFYEDRLILLTSGKHSGEKYQIRLSDYAGKIIYSKDIPEYAGTPQQFFRDYTGGTILICKDTLFKVDVMGNSLYLWHLYSRQFQEQIKPIKDSLHSQFYFCNEWPDYPLFNYYTLKNGDSISRKLKAITDTELMKFYNLEYEYLPSRQKLEARRLASYYNTDKTIIAALMSGFTKSMFYSPLYAPLFTINDTICILDHHSNYLFHFTPDGTLTDSVSIAYHHPKRWQDWKRDVLKDETENKLYARFSRDGRQYLKQIDVQKGKINGMYKLQNHSADRIKIKNGFVYYVYRPFESTQEKFLYREQIQLILDK